MFFSASFAIVTSDFTEISSKSVYFDLEIMRVWCERVRGDMTGCTLDLHVHDMEMGVVESAHVEFHYSIDTYVDGVYEEVYRIINGTTDGQGSVTFDIEYPSIDPERPYIRLSGFVYNEDLEQRFEERIQIQALSPFRHYGPYRLEAKALNPLPLSLESPDTLEMILLDGQDLLASTQVGYSVFTLHEVITSGTSTTDPEGLLTISMITPGFGSVVGFGTNLDVRIAAEVDGEMEHILVQLVCWHEMGPYLDWYDEGTSLEVEQGSPGGDLNVSLSFPEAGSSDEETWFVWGLGPIDWGTDVTFEGGNWTRVSSMSMFGGMKLVPGVYTGGVYTAEVPIPDFVPDGSQLYVVGVIESHEESGMVRRLTYIEGFSYTAEVEDDDDGILETSIPDWYMWILVLIIVSVAVVVLLLRVRR